MVILIFPSSLILHNCVFPYLFCLNLVVLDWTTVSTLLLQKMNVFGNFTCFSCFDFNSSKVWLKAVSITGIACNSSLWGCAWALWFLTQSKNGRTWCVSFCWYDNDSPIGEVCITHYLLFFFNTELTSLYTTYLNRTKQKYFSKQN